MTKRKEPVKAPIKRKAAVPKYVDGDTYDDQVKRIYTDIVCTENNVRVLTVRMNSAVEHLVRHTNMLKSCATRKNIGFTYLAIVLCFGVLALIGIGQDMRIAKLEAVLHIAEGK